MTSLKTYWHTLRHLRPIQFYGRLYFRLITPQVCTDETKIELRPQGKWNEPARRLASLVGPGEFVFLNEWGSLTEHGWDGPDKSKLWRYNQHYFDDLNAEQAASRIEWHKNLIRDWIASNPPSMGSGWESYPTSLRLVNWIKWSLTRGELPAYCLESMVIQARWLEKRIEWHLLGNHLFANAKALVFSGIYFSGSEADRWLNRGISILEREISEQILPDGGHFELSTMYHALIFEDLLDLCNLLECYKSNLPIQFVKLLESYKKATSKMLMWLDSMSHTDGELSFFNDAAFGIAPRSYELRQYATRLGISNLCLQGRSKDLAYSGYVRLESENVVALLDIASIGPDYLPGHAHADTLSFELSLYGQRLLVNTGTSCYQRGRERLYQRGTIAHNTVAISEENSSEVWSSFRVARRARPFNKKVDIDSLPMCVECSHDGYKRLDGSPTHTRSWILYRDKLVVEDTVDSPDLPAQARFYFHPAVDLETLGHEGLALLLGGQQAQWFVECGIAHYEDSEWFPEFGKSISNKCLVVDLVNGRSKIHWRWIAGS